MYRYNEPTRPICLSVLRGSKEAMDFEVLAAYGLVQKRESQILNKAYTLYWLSISGGLFIGDYTEHSMEASAN
jgi:hypothetical protein